MHYDWGATTILGWLVTAGIVGIAVFMTWKAFKKRTPSEPFDSVEKHWNRIADNLPTPAMYTRRNRDAPMFYPRSATRDQYALEAIGNVISPFLKGPNPPNWAIDIYIILCAAERRPK